MRIHLLALLVLCCCLPAADSTTSAPGSDPAADLAAQEQVYRSLFAAAEAEADSRRGRAALIETLWSRYSEADLAPIRPYLKQRLRELITEPDDAHEHTILLSLLQEDLDRSTMPDRALLLRKVELLEGQAREVRGEERVRVAVDLTQTWNELAAQAAAVRDFEHAAEWFDEVASLSRKLRDQDGYRIAKNLSDRMEDSGDRYADLLEEQAAIGDGGEAGTQAALARGFLMEQDQIAAWRHARGGGDDPMAQLARLHWRSQRWGATATATGLTVQDAERLRQAAAMGDRSTLRQYLLLAISDPALIETALPAFQELDAQNAISPILQHSLTTLAERISQAAAAGSPVTVAPEDLQNALASIRTALSGRLDDHERVALLDIGLALTSSIAARSDDLPQVLTLAARVDHQSWQTARDELAADWPEELLVLTSPAGGDEAAYIRQGWEAVFDHENLPINASVLNADNVRIENGIAIIDLPDEQVWAGMGDLNRYDEIRYRFRYDSDTGYDGYWYFGVAVDYQVQAVRVIVSQEQIAVASARTPENGDLGTFPLRRGWNEVHIAYLPEQDHSVVVTVNGSSATPMAGFGKKPGIWFLANEPRHTQGERTLYLQSLLGRTQDRQ